MKKSIIASVIALGMMGGYAHAASQVIFSGAVSAKTCELAPSVNGSIPANQVVTLATAEPNTEGAATTFVMKPVDPTASGCTGLTGQNTISVGWSGSNLGAQGFKANPGSVASDAVVLLTAKNSKTANTAITASAPSVDFAGDKLTADGLQFDAKTKGGAQSGNFQSTASFTVAYK
jgi:type 1 fimbria pilin